MKGGLFQWTNRSKSSQKNLDDCYRWNTMSPYVCTNPAPGTSALIHDLYNYPGRTNIGRIPTLRRLHSDDNKDDIEMTRTRRHPIKSNLCDAVPGISPSKLRYLNKYTTFDPRQCQYVEMMVPSGKTVYINKNKLKEFLQRVPVVITPKKKKSGGRTKKVSTSGKEGRGQSAGRCGTRT